MIVAICIIVVGWMVASHLEMQRALRWWFQQQTAQFLHQSEHIQNGPLQDLFVIRRGLELALAPTTERAESTLTRDWLNKTEAIHRSLEQLSDFLAPPYLTESLPLALQSLMRRWQQAYPTWALETGLPIAWNWETPEQNRLILELLAQLLQITVPTALPATTLCLAPQGDWGELTLQLGYPNLTALNTAMQTEELRYIRRTFRCLAPGRCFCRRRHLQVTWHFRWRL